MLLNSLAAQFIPCALTNRLKEHKNTLGITKKQKDEINKQNISLIKEINILKKQGLSPLMIHFKLGISRTKYYELQKIEKIIEKSKIKVLDSQDADN